MATLYILLQSVRMANLYILLQSVRMATLYISLQSVRMATLYISLQSVRMATLDSSVKAFVTVILAAVTRRPDAVLVDVPLAGLVTTVRQVCLDTTQCFTLYVSK